MNRIFSSLIVLGMLLIATGCASGNLVAPDEGLGTPASEAEGNEIQLLHEGKGPLEITPDPDGKANTTTSSADQGGGNVSPSGGEPQSKTIGEESGQIESFAPSALVADQGEIKPLNWLTHQDQTFLFSIDYPDLYTILPENILAEETDPLATHRVLFQDIALATGDTASFEIPKFTIEIFELGDLTLDAFLDYYAVGAEREVYLLEDLTGWRVYFNRLSAPNEYYFFSSHGYVYKLTPLGNYSEQMLHSFQIKP
ncbi:hypothetical protein ACFLY4_03280 [Chloroflexota bacterium]